MNSIPKIADLLIKKGLPFAIYYLPSSGSCNLVFQKDYTPSEIEILDIESNSGFVIARFESAKTGLAKLIKPDFVLTEGDNFDNELNFINSLPNKDEYHFNDNYNISESDYLNRADYIINKLKEDKLQKVVLSRVAQKNIDKNLVFSDLIIRLKEKYNDAFVYIFYLPGDGIWCGASPETLFKVTNNFVITDALAGTKLADEKNNDPVWTMKEKEEQHFVTMFIESVLSSLSINNFERNGPITINAGNLFHLQTIFKIPIDEVKNKTGKLIAGLHPTPAVCGIPKAEAYLLIQKAEQHERRYYTGFLGPWNLKNGSTDNHNECQLFVNLRCAELDKNKINLYVGGGLTSASSPKAEYEETVHKSQTLLSVVENL